MSNSENILSPLYENALDSLETGMQFFRDKKHKFAILLIFHSIELLLKELLSREHPILIYRNIDKIVTYDSQTVGLYEMLVRFNNTGIHLTKAEQLTLKSLQKKRNRIEHHRYDPKHDDHDTIGQALKFIISFADTYLESPLEKHINKKLLDEIKQIILTYQERIGDADHQLEKWGTENFIEGLESEDFCGTVECPACAEEFLVLDDERFNNAYCFFCKADMVAIECDTCGKPFIPIDGKDFTCHSCLRDVW